MRVFKAGLIAVGVLLAAGTAAAQDRSRDSEANAAFVAYPKASLAAGEEGIVRYRVRIDRRGRAHRCEVIQSSGHVRLDQATCAMLMENARFTPASDRRGKGRGSSYEGRVVWRIG
jgi:TonB family protein